MFTAVLLHYSQQPKYGRNPRVHQGIYGSRSKKIQTHTLSGFGGKKKPIISNSINKYRGHHAKQNEPEKGRYYMI